MADPGESTPLLSSKPIGTGSFDRKQAMVSFRRKSIKKLSSRQISSLKDEDSAAGAAAGAAIDSTAAFVQKMEYLPVANPIEGLAPLFPHGGIEPYDGREYVPYREPSLVKSVPAFPPYTRMARHRSFYLWWTNEFRHWWKSARLLVRLGGLYVYSFDPIAAPKVLLLNPEKHKSIKTLFKFAKKLGQGGQLRVFIKTCKPFTRSMRMIVGGWRWFEAAPCRRIEVGVEETMAFIGNRVSRMVARGGTDLLGLEVVLPLQRFLFRGDYLPYPEAYHPIAVCVSIGILRAVSPFAASFQGSRVGRVLTRRFFSSAKNRWLPVQRIGDLNLLSDDCQEKDEADQTADLVIIARRVATALGKVQSNGDGNGDDNGKVVRQYEALRDEGFVQCGAGSGGYAVYQFRFKSTTILLHVTPYGPSILDVMPCYLVLEFETSVDIRQQKWANSLAPISSIQLQGPQVLEGYAYQGAFFSPHHFAELKTMYDKQLLAYEAACKKLPIVAKNTRHGGPPRDLPTLKTFLEAGKRSRKRKQNIREFNELQKVVRSVAKEILASIKEEKKRGEGGDRLAPKGVILYFEGLDCSGKSSTGGLVQAALEFSGYDVGMRQYNRPPTAEQRMRPWTDRFDVPGSSSILDLSETQEEDGDGEHIGLVWDRGPAGDFVYGNLNELSPEDKKKRYEEFMAFDRECREKDILFLKLFFVTNRDSIAKTLGKRLAQKKMARDLTTWLQACRSRGEVDELSYEGLEAISAHIDPTDFIAFNQYERNLRIFSNFVMNTDTDDNPWVVVNTGDRYAARKALMSTFREHLIQFQSRGKRCSPCLGPKPSVPQAKSEVIGMDEMMKKKFKSSWRNSMIAWVTLLALLVLAGTYRENTDWDRAWIVRPPKYNISALLEYGNDDNNDEVVNVNVVDDVEKKNVEIIDVDDGSGKEAKAAKAEPIPQVEDAGED